MSGPNPIADGAAVAEKPTRPEGERIHVTYVDRWLECGYRASQYAAQRWQEPARPETSRGRAIHAAREFALKAYLKAGALPPAADCVERADVAVQEDAKAALDSGDEALVAEVDAIREEARLFAQADREAVLPDLAPHVIAVEETIEVPLGGDGLDRAYVLTGRPDAVARDPITKRLQIPDLKTSKYAPSAASVNASTQHSLYSALVHHRYGEPCGHSIHHLRILKTKPRSALGPNQRAVPMGENGTAVVTAIATERTADDVAAALRRLRFVLDAREQGYSPPASASFLSPCVRCVHRGHADSQQRCPFVPATRAGEMTEADDA